MLIQTTRPLCPKGYAIVFSLFAFCLIFFTSLNNAQAEDEEFWAALQQGSKVVLVQHAKLDEDVGDPFSLDPSCFIERNLSEEGRTQAQVIGHTFRHYQVPIEAVYASPHCRTKDTAQLAFGQYEIKPELRLIRALPEDQANQNMANIKRLIGDYTGAGNLILVTHRPNIGELIHQRVQPGYVAVVEPLGDGLFDLIAIKVFD